MKKYISKSDIAFNIVVDGRRRQISFEPISSGGSHYFCKDGIICELMEKHQDFNKLFFLDKQFDCKPSDGETEPGKRRPSPQVSVDTDARTAAPKAGRASVTAPETEQKENPASAVREYPDVCTFSEAKDTLVSLGAVSGALRSKETVLRAAEEMKVSFPNLA